MHMTRTRLRRCSRARTCASHTTELCGRIPYVFFLEPENGTLHTFFLVIKFSTNSKWHCHPSRLPVSFAPPQKLQQCFDAWDLYERWQTDIFINVVPGCCSYKDVVMRDAMDAIGGGS